MGKRKRSAARRARRQGAGEGVASGPARSRGTRRDLLWAAGLTFLAWGHRVAFLRSNRDWSWPYTFLYEGDSETFFKHARALLGGDLYDGGIPFHPPGFAWLLAGLHAVLGAGHEGAQVPHAAVKTALALLGSLPVGLLYLLAVPYLGRTAALVAALLALYHFGLYVLAIAPVSEGLYLTLLLLALLLWSRRLEHPLAAPAAGPAPAGRRGGWRSALALGLLLGALALTRAEGSLIAAIVCGTGVAGWLAARLRSRRPPAGPVPERPALAGGLAEGPALAGLGRGRPALAGLGPWVLVALGWALMVAPWTIRNAVRLAAVNRGISGTSAGPLPTFVPLTLYGPINLALANNPQADGTFSRDFLASKAGSPVLDLADPQHLDFLLHGDAMAWDYARREPGAWARLVLRKLRLYFGAWRLGWTQWDWPGGLRGVRRPVDAFVPDSAAGLWLGPPLALLGLLVCLRSPGGPRRWAVLVLLSTAAGMVATGLFFGYARLGLLSMPFWLSLVAAALRWLADRARRKDSGWSFALRPSDPSRRLLLGLAGAAACLLALEVWGASGDRNFRATGTNVPGETYLNRDAEIHLEALPTSSASP